MKLKTEQIVNFIESGIALTKQYPMAMAYKMKVNLEACKPIYTAYEQQKNELLDKYCNKDENGGFAVIGNMYDITDFEGWNNDYNEIVSTEVNVAISEIPVEMLDRCDDHFSVPELELISFMIKEV